MDTNKIFDSIHGATKGPFGTGVLYAGAIGLILADVIPTPADAFYYYRQKQLREKWKKGEITPQKYWSKIANAYYFYNPLWWSAVLGFIYLSKGDIGDKAKIGLAIVGLGAVVGVFYKNDKKDIEELRRETKPDESQYQFSGPVNNSNKTKSNERYAIKQGNRIKIINR